MNPIHHNETFYSKYLIPAVSGRPYLGRETPLTVAKIVHNRGQERRYMAIHQGAEFWFSREDMRTQDEQREAGY